MRVVLLPGLDGTGLLFKPLLSILPNHLSTQIISYPKNELLNYQQLTNYVKSRIPVSENFILVAESFSGPIAYAIAQYAPKNLIHLVLAASFIANPRPTILTLNRILPTQLIFKISIPNFIIKRYLLDKSATTDELNNLKSVIHSVPVKTLAYRLNLMANLFAITTKISCPTSYLQATNDKLISRRCLNLIQRNIPNLKLIKLKGPHLILQSKPKESANAILSLFSNV